VFVWIIITDAFLWVLGPAKWGEFSHNALGLHQSPIVIQPSDAVYEQQLQERTLQIHYTDMESCSLVNTGRSVQFNAPAGKCCTSSFVSVSFESWQAPWEWGQ